MSKRNFLQQAGHALRSFAGDLGSAASRLLNASIGGSTRQTTSARTYLEAHPPGLSDLIAGESGKVRRWRRFEWFVNALFWPFGGWGHTQRSLEAEVRWHKMALFRYGEGPDPREVENE